MPSQAKQKRVQQAPCRNCNLLTPAWRELCVHCGEPLPDAGAAESQDLEGTQTAPGGDSVVGFGVLASGRSRVGGGSNV